jgi:hypothetical protein
MCVCALELEWGQVCADADQVQPKPLNPESSEHRRDADFIFFHSKEILFFMLGDRENVSISINVLLVNSVEKIIFM